MAVARLTASLIAASSMSPGNGVTTNEIVAPAASRLRRTSAPAQLIEPMPASSTPSELLIALRMTFCSSAPNSAHVVPESVRLTSTLSASSTAYE